MVNAIGMPKPKPTNHHCPHSSLLTTEHTENKFWIISIFIPNVAPARINKIVVPIVISASPNFETVMLPRVSNLMPLIFYYILLLVHCLILCFFLRKYHSYMKNSHQMNHAYRLNAHKHILDIF